MNALITEAPIFSLTVYTLSHHITHHTATLTRLVNLILRCVTRYCACSQQKLKTKLQSGRNVNPNVSSKASGDHSWLGPSLHQLKEKIRFTLFSKLNIQKLNQQAQVKSLKDNPLLFFFFFLMFHIKHEIKFYFI